MEFNKFKSLNCLSTLSEMVYLVITLIIRLNQSTADLIMHVHVGMMIDVKILFWSENPTSYFLHWSTQKTSFTVCKLQARLTFSIF